VDVFEDLRALAKERRMSVTAVVVEAMERAKKDRSRRRAVAVVEGRPP
jgi:hypothetical protein